MDAVISIGGPYLKYVVLKQRSRNKLINYTL